ncbi:MAG: ThiF family adenylyltransferase [Betaproteobacteria bacterium]|nr:ThiF family adenylyltransferase [Betaproteobacteria bacterium]
MSRIDPDWALARDHQLDVLHIRRTKHVLILGCGSLGSPIAELLARAGIGKLTLVDFETFEAENSARHVLGMLAIGQKKSIALQERLRSEIPGVEIKALVAVASSWIADSCKRGDFDLVIDCTGEGGIRVLLSKLRKQTLGDCGIVHAWLEPFGAAAHAVYLRGNDIWPDSDPADSLVNVATWPTDTRVNLPACGAGFHVYAAADAWQAAGFVGERLLNIIDGKVTQSLVWSWIRTRSFFLALPVNASLKSIVPENGSRDEAVMITRNLNALLSSHDP